MNLYRDGQFLETYREPRSYDLLTSYISKHAEPTSLPTLPETTAPVVTATPEVHFEAQQQQQRETHQAAVPAKDLNPDGKVLVLDDKTFRDVVTEGHIFVKFYAPWYIPRSDLRTRVLTHRRCGHCKKLAPIWTQLAAQVQHKLTIAEVNCEAYEGLCRAEGVPGFPQLVYYGGKGQGKVEYTSRRKLEQLRAFAEKVSGPCVALLLLHHPLDPFALAGRCKNCTMRTSLSVLRSCRSCTSCSTRILILLSLCVPRFCARVDCSSVSRTTSPRRHKSFSAHLHCLRRPPPSSLNTSTFRPTPLLSSRSRTTMPSPLQCTVFPRQRTRRLSLIG